MIYNSIESTLPIDSIRCYVITEGYKTVNYFFGVKTKEILPSLKSPVPASRCRLVSTTLQDKLGKLIKVNENTYQTINKLKIKYTWPTSNAGTVANIVF